MDQIEQQIKSELHIAREAMTNNIHTVLAHSYSFFFIFFLVGVALDMFFPIRIFKHQSVVTSGFILLFLASALIIWAQHTSRNLTGGHLTKEAFKKGPYIYSRSPTHWGLFLLVLGFGIVANAFFVVVTTIISFLISKFIFLPKEEAILAQKYGTCYLDYKREVRL